MIIISSSMDIHTHTPKHVLNLIMPLEHWKSTDTDLPTFL